MAPEGLDLTQLQSWAFDVWQRTEDELIPLAFAMFDDLHLISHYSLPRHMLWAFIEDVRASYLHNPYHNWRHAFDVLHAMYLFLKLPDVAEQLGPLEQLAAMFAAISHDLEHPGLNNTFQINAATPLAICYNDISVLENHHASRAFSLVSKPKNAFLSVLSKTEYRELRKLVISGILATDLSRHMDLISKFNACVPTYSRENPRDRAALLDMLLKCADVSNPIRPLPLATYWSDMIQEENFLQGEHERRLGLPISPFMDRENPLREKMGVSFLDYIVMPLFSAVAKVLPSIGAFHEQLTSMRSYWATLLAQREEQNGAAAAAAPPPTAAVVVADTATPQSTQTDAGSMSVSAQTAATGPPTEPSLAPPQKPLDNAAVALQELGRRKSVDVRRLLTPRYDELAAAVGRLGSCPAGSVADESAASADGDRAGPHVSDESVV